jgi:hypothetical protein
MDPWTAFLTWLTDVIVPNWTELVGMLPLFIILGVVGPILTLIAVMWAWHFLKRRVGHARVAIPEVVAAPRDANGLPVIPPNVPYCASHGLIYPPERTTCEVDGSNLLVRCPVDATVREAAIKTCTACGTKYVLGAAKTPLLVTRSGKPPAGGAAAA